jgi:hypothetical protein
MDIIIFRLDGYVYLYRYVIDLGNLSNDVSLLLLHNKSVNVAGNLSNDVS